MGHTRLEPRTLGGLRVYAGGEGRPIVLLHGLGGSAANWLHLLPELVVSHHVLAVDLPGHGGSPAPARGAGIDDLADDVAAALQAAGCREALVAGHSFGAHVAARLAARRPELVRALLLVCPSGVKTLRARARFVVALIATIRPGRAVELLSRRLGKRAWFRRAVFEPWLVADGRELSPAAVRSLLRDIHTHADVRGPAAAMVRDDPRAALETIRCPTLVVWGARDVQLPLDDAFEQARRAGASLRVIADCGHLPIIERPEAILDALFWLGAWSGR